MRIPKNSKLGKQIAKQLGKQAGKLLSPKEGKASKAEREFMFKWKALGGPPLTREHKFSDSGHRFDFAIPELKLAIEIEGGVWMNRTVTRRDGTQVVVQGGRHNSGKGYINDLKKYNKAELLGWTKIGLATEMITGENIRPIIEWIHEKEVQKETRKV